MWRSNDKPAPHTGYCHILYNLFQLTALTVEAMDTSEQAVPAQCETSEIQAALIFHALAATPQGSLTASTEEDDGAGRGITWLLVRVCGVAPVASC